MAKLKIESIDGKFKGEISSEEGTSEDLMDTLVSFVKNGLAGMLTQEGDGPEEEEQKEAEEEFGDESDEGVPVVTIRYKDGEIQEPEIEFPKCKSEEDLCEIITLVSKALMRTNVALITAALHHDEDAALEAIYYLYRSAKRTVRAICEDD